MKMIDTHCHLNFPQYNKQRDEVIHQCFAQGIKYLINIGTDLETSIKSIELTNKYENIFCSVGFHPHDAKSYDEDGIKSLLHNKKIVAIGEIGLDYYRNLSPRAVQQQVFRKQIRIAKANQLPIIVHCREAEQDTFQILQDENPEKVVFHCFSGDYNFAQEVLNQGWFISFTGIITYDKARSRPVIQDVPLEKFFVETDAPFLTPHPFRGKLNKPYYVRYVIEKIAEIKNISPNKIAEITTANAIKFFHLL